MNLKHKTDVTRLDEKVAHATKLELILLVDHSRAGNTFFMRVFDRHQEVFCIPNVNYFLGSLKQLLKNRHEISSSDAYDMVLESDVGDVARDLDSEIIKKYARMGDDPNCNLDRPLMRRLLKEILDSHGRVNVRQILVAVHVAYAEAVGRDILKCQYFLQADSVNDLDGSVIPFATDNFPNCRFIHLVRDPRACFSSLRHQYINQRGSMYPVINPHYRWLTTQYGGVWSYACITTQRGNQTMKTVCRTLSQDKYTRVRNEDMNRDFVNTMAQICAWIGVPTNPNWAHADYVPTTNGQPWLSVSAYSSQYTNVDGGRLESLEKSSQAYAKPNPGVTERWKSQVTVSELKFLNNFFYSELLEDSYETFENKNKPSTLSTVLKSFVFFKGELPIISINSKTFRKEHLAESIKDLLLLPLFFAHSRISFLVYLLSSKTSQDQGNQ